MTQKLAGLITIIVAIGILSYGCENREVNEGEAFKPREIHEDIAFHFDTLLIDGVEYLILEKDNNNPHEGFGFMAFRANKLMEKQDTLLTYMRTMHELQTRMYARQFNMSLDEARAEVKGIFHRFLNDEQRELDQLEQTDFSNEKKKTQEKH